MLAGIRDILIISTPQDLPRFRELLGTGEQWGLRFEYAAQPRPEGLAQAFLIGRDFVGPGPRGAGPRGQHLPRPRSARAPARRPRPRTAGATVFAYYVRDPERYGVVELGPENRAVSIEEKPARPRSNYAVTGLYFYDNRVLDIAARSAALRPGRAGDHRRQPGLPRGRDAPRRGPGAGLRLARHRDPRIAPERLDLHRDRRAAPGPEDLLPGGDRLPDGLHRRGGSSGRSPSRCARTTTVATSSTCSRTGERSDEGHPHRAPGDPADRAQDLRRRARTLLRELPGPALRRGRHPRSVRAGQPLAIGSWHPAGPALPGAACAGEAGAGASRERSSTSRSTSGVGRPASGSGWASSCPASSRASSGFPPASRTASAC